MPAHPNVLVPGETVLIVVDVQEKFRAAIPDFAGLAAACARLVRVFRILGLPVIATEQYPKGLGPTAPEVLEALAPPGPLPEKTSFSALGCAVAVEELRASGARVALVCGLEAHVCVSQTAHDLLARGLAVQVAADAVASRRPSDRMAGLHKMERSGAVLTSSEMAAFELLGDARNPRFKEVQAMFKSTVDRTDGGRS